MLRINFVIYGHFVLVDIPALCKQGSKYAEDLKQAYLRGNLTQNRRLTGNTVFKSKKGKKHSDDTCYFPDWILTIDGVDIKVSFKIVDTSALQGQASLKDLCKNTGVNIAKDLITKEELKDMSKTHLEKP